MIKNLTRCVKPNNGITAFCMSQYKMNHRHQQSSYHHFPSDGRNSIYDYRIWTPVNSESRKPGFEFTFLNYNILSQRLLEMHNYLYDTHDKASLHWIPRLSNLIREILYNNPDVLCCQEVQKSHLTDIKERLKPLNYDVIYKKRTGDMPDGCAIFYKRDLFRVVEQHKLEFKQPGVEILNRENVAIICKFALVNDPSVEFIVATTHLLYNPKRQDIRLAQVQVLLAELDRIAKIPITSENGEAQHLPVILSGDFNLKPHSAPYKLIINGSLNYANLSHRTLISTGGKTTGRSLLPIKLGITDECQHMNQEVKLFHSENNKTKVEQEIEISKEIVNLFQTGVLRHRFKFASAYQNLQTQVSTHQDEWSLVDYIFFAKGMANANISELQAIAYLSLPSAQDCERVRLKIPNFELGSDHLMLAARFRLSPPARQQASTSTKL